MHIEKNMHIIALGEVKLAMEDDIQLRSLLTKFVEEKIQNTVVIIKPRYIIIEQLIRIMCWNIFRDIDENITKIVW